MRYHSSDLPTRNLLACEGEAPGRLLRSLFGAAVLALLATALLSILAVQPASSAPARSTLRAAVTVVGDLVTVGDFFEDAGPLAGRPLFRAPDLGTTGPVGAARVVDMARAVGLLTADAGGLVEVQVSRLSRQIEARDLARLVAAEAMRRPGRADDVALADLEVVFDGAVDPIVTDVRSAEPIRVVSLVVGPSGRFDALLQVDQGEKTARLHLRGTVVETIAVAVLNRNLARGDLLGPDDVRIERQPRARLAGQRSLAETSDLVGLQARRAMRSGQTVAAADFARPQVVARGDAVTIVYRTASLSVTGRGQAQQAGAVGDLVTVLNPQSKRTVHAIVAGPGRVVINAAPTSVAALAKVDQ